MIARSSRLAFLLVSLGMVLFAGRLNAAGLAVEKSDFGTTRDNQPAELYTLSNPSGMIAKVSTYGALLIELDVLDKSGKSANVVLGYPTLAEYERNTAMFGATVGRYANRIAAGKFTIDGQESNVTKNSGDNHIHGGRKGFNRVMWKAQPSQTDKAVSVKLSYRSLDGEEGFPGNLDATVTYTLTADNELKIEYGATTDKPTVVNLTNHSYFNMAGAGNITGHVLTINADRYTPTVAGGIPTGEIKPVKDSPLDFTKPAPVGEHASQMRGPFDHNYVINGGGQGSLVHAATVVEPTSGRTMELWTTYPGVQFYTGNPRGLCLEAEFYPDSPNHPNFPSPILRPGQMYSQTIALKFATH